MKIYTTSVPIIGPSEIINQLDFQGVRNLTMAHLTDWKLCIPQFPVSVKWQVNISQLDVLLVNLCMDMFCPKCACSEAFSVREARRQCRNEGKELLPVGLVQGLRYSQLVLCCSPIT